MSSILRPFTRFKQRTKANGVRTLTWMAEETLTASQWRRREPKWRTKADENKGLWRRTREPKWRSKACAGEERKKTNEEDEGREKTNSWCTDEEEARKKKSFFFKNLLTFVF